MTSQIPQKELKLRVFFAVKRGGEYKKIMKKSYKYGIEIECGLDYNNYNSFLLKLEESRLPFSTKPDSSIELNDSDLKSVEIISNPLAYNNMLRGLSKLSRLLDEFEFTSNKSCGLHIHISNKRFFLKKNLLKIANFWLAIEDVAFATQPKSRLTNYYCRRFLGRWVHGRSIENVRSKKEEVINDCATFDRYTAFNVNALAKHGTLEFRLFANTTNTKKMSAYLEFVRQVCNYGLEKYKQDEVSGLFKMSISNEKIDKVFSLLELSAKTKKLLKGRVQRNNFLLLKEQQEKANAYLEKKHEYEHQKIMYEKARVKFNLIQDYIYDIQGAFPT